MLRFKLTASVLLLTCVTSYVAAQNQILRTNVNPLVLRADGREMRGGWTIAPELNPDEYQTTARTVEFVSDCDSITLALEEWESRDLTIVTQTGDSANVRVTRRAVNPYDNPEPRLLSIAPSGLLTREQAAFDIKAMVYSLNQIHPDIFSVCKQEDLMRAVNRAVETLPDSLSQLELYRRAAPIVAMIGDGHTNMVFPYNAVFTLEYKQMPLYGNINSSKEFVCKSSLDSIIQRGDKVLSINGVRMETLINSMLPYESGEREHFKLARVEADFNALHELLYHADEYKVEYLPASATEPLFVTLPATDYEQVVKRCPKVRENRPYSAYSYTVDSAADVAVMEFNSFIDENRMTAFADSMFRDLRQRGINNLIIDIRENGGGASAVGDILLRYITDEPFVQMDKALVKITPLTASLMTYGSPTPGLSFNEETEDDYIKPLTDAEGHYNGNVYLLTSNRTFSSAGSFAWAFKECGMGTVVGEETGGMNVCYGDILVYDLPVSKLHCTVSFKRFWQFRADENDIHGTLPDIAVPAAEALDAALQHIARNRR